MNIRLIGEPKVIMSNPESLHGYFAWPTVKRLKDGRLAAVASGYRLGHVCPFGKTVISYSEDNGESYSIPAPVIDTPLDDRDGGLCPFGENGFVVTSFNNTVAFQRETAANIGDPLSRAYRNAYLDLVPSEAEQRYLGSTFRVTLDGGKTFSEIGISPVSSPHGPIELRSGKLLWVGRAFEANDPPTSDDYLKAYYLDPVSRKFSYIGTIPQVMRDGEPVRAYEPYTYEREDGRLICHLRVPTISEPRSHTTYQSISDDGGKSWTNPVPLLGGGDLDGTPCHIFKHSSGVLVSVYGKRKPPFGIVAMISTDGGESWDTSDYRIYTNSISPDLGYPSTVELDDGSCLTVFYAKETVSSPCVIMQQKWVLEP